MKLIKSLSLFTLVYFYSMAIVAQNKEWQCLNDKGEVAFTKKAKYVYSFSNGLAKIKDQRVINNKWVTAYGYINTVGSIVIPCQYDKADDFTADVTWVKFKGADFYTLIDKTGNTIPTKNYKKVGSFYSGYEGISENICAVYENGKMGFIDNTGKEVIPCKYLGSSTFSEGLTCVTDYDGTEEKYGFIDVTGKVIIPFQFKQAGTSSFHNGECRASVSGKTVLINKKGEVIFKTQYKSLQDFSFGYGAVCTKSNRTGWGFIDKNDNWLVQPEYDHVTPFNEEGYAIVEKNNLKGVIDTTGKMVFPMKYETIYMEPKKEGRICMILPSSTPVSMYDAEKEYYDIGLNLIKLDNVLFLSGADGEKLMMYADSEKKIGYMNRNFEIIVPAKYKKGQKLSEGLAWVRIN